VGNAAFLRHLPGAEAQNVAQFPNAAGYLEQILIHIQTPPRHLFEQKTIVCIISAGELEINANISAACTLKYR
jgi:hypothetical protein